MKTTCQRIPGGWLHLAEPAAEAVRDWIVSGAPTRLPRQALVPHRSRHGAVWHADVPGAGPCILKAYSVETGRGAGRRLESAFKLRFARRGLRTLRIAAALRAAGIPTFEPLAFWSDSRGGRRNFLLYRLVPGDVVGDRWMGELASVSPPARPDPPMSATSLHAFLERAGELVRKMNEAGVVHADLHPKNFVSPNPDDPAAPISLIDLDSARRLFAPGRRARFTAFVRALRKMALCFRDEDDPGLRAFVRGWSGGDAEEQAAVLRALRFWRNRPWHRRLDAVTAWVRFPPPAHHRTVSPHPINPDGKPHPTKSGVPPHPR